MTKKFLFKKPQDVVVLTNYFNQLYSGTRNNFDGTVGFELVPTENIVVSALGRAISTTIAQNHSVGIWLVSNQSLLASATITPSSTADTLGYAYETLVSTITLTSGTTYRIGTQEFNGGDLWADIQTMANHLSIANIITGVYSSGGFAYPNASWGAGQAYVPPTFFK